MKSMSEYRVLILDAEFIASLTILRSLSKAGIHCDLSSALNKPLCSSSRYAKKTFRYPDPLTDKNHFVEEIARLIEKEHYDLVIPVTERSLIPLSESDEMNAYRKYLAICEHKNLIKVLDKATTLEIAKQNHVSIPFSHTINTLSELTTLLAEIDYPVVIKPGQSIPDAEERRQLSVCYAFNEDELLSQCEELIPYCQLLIQQYATGIGTGVEVLANQGEIVYAFQHERIHEIPLTGGGSCLRKSIAVNPVLLKASQKLIKALNWHGVAMVEFKWQPDTDEFWLMEINGRFWGSLPLASAAGADFPKMLFDLLVLNKTPDSSTYRENVYCRKLADDLYWLEQVIRRNDDNPLFSYPEKSQILKDFALMLHPTRHYMDIQSLTDPVPGLIDLYAIISSYFKRFSGLLIEKLKLKFHNSSLQKNKVRQRIDQSQTILFLCYGNINRSALAQVVAEQNLKSSQKLYLSAGFHKQDQRPADTNMVKLAAEEDLNLSDWKSKRLTPELVQQADTILAMETAHLDRLYEEFPNSRNKSYLLGSLTADQFKSPEIVDPYNQDSSIFKQVFERIKLAVLAMES